MQITAKLNPFALLGAAALLSACATPNAIPSDDDAQNDRNAPVLHATGVAACDDPLRELECRAKTQRNGLKAVGADADGGFHQATIHQGYEAVRERKRERREERRRQNQD